MVLLLAGVLPVLLLLGILGLRRPLWSLAAYAFVVPWGSSFSLPLGLPPAFSSISTLIGIGAAVSMVAHVLVARNRASWLHPAVPVWVMFFGLALITTSWSVNPSATADELLVLASLVALFVATGLMAPSPADLTLLERAIVAGGAIVGVVALVMLVTGTLPSGVGGVPRFEIPGGGGENGDPNITAASLLLPFFVALARSLRTGGLERLLSGTTAGLLGMAIFLTVSRGALVSMAVGVGIIAIAGLGRRAVVFASAVLLVGALVFFVAPAETRDRLDREGSSGRTGVWQIGLTACETHCAIGSGYGTFPDVHEEILLTDPVASGSRRRFVAHNIFLQAAVETGYLGLSLLAASFAAMLWALRHVPRMTRAPAIASLVALAATNFFLSNMDFKYFWLVLIYGAVVALSHGDPARRPRDARDPRSDAEPSRARSRAILAGSA